jgi:hypothetical protein
MCGTFTQLFAQALAIGVIDTILSPRLGEGEVMVFVDFLMKGIATFWLYKWGQCTLGVHPASPLSNYSAIGIIIGGFVGAITLAVVNMIVGRNMFTGETRYITYLLDAIAVHMVYGISHGVIAGYAANM